jgi:hypothetical protein
MTAAIKFNTIQTQDMISAYQTGQTLREIGNKYGCDKRVIGKCLQANGIQLRDSGAPRSPIIDGKKNCALCKSWKEIERFYANCAYCKECRCKASAATGLLNRYGITEDEYLKMAEAQNNLCAICNQPETEMNNNRSRVKRLSVDHCHTTNKVRKLLCNRCNVLLGKMQENVELLQRAIQYLKEFKP